jgi:hypothetical protein
MSNDDRTYVDDAVPATLSRVGTSDHYATFQDAMRAWYALAVEERKSASIKIRNGGTIYHSWEIPWLYRNP